MRPILNLKNIALPQIDFDDFSYSLSPERDAVPDETLRQSIARYGILHPPIIREHNPGYYTIVAGRKRLLALRALQAESACACLVVSSQVPEVDVFHILLEEIRLTRDFTAVEKAFFLQKISVFLDERLTTSEFLPRLGLAPHSFAIKQTLKLLDLEEPILRLLHHGGIHETVMQDLIVLSPQDRMALFELIASLHLSVSYQKKLLTMCRELASRGNTGIAALLDNDAVRDILQHQESNPPQKTKNLMLWLSRRHMPRSGQAEEEFSRFITAMQLPQNVSVAHTPFFEDDILTLSMAFPNRISLQDAWDKIKHAAHRSDD